MTSKLQLSGSTEQMGLHTPKRRSRVSFFDPVPSLPGREYLENPDRRQHEYAKAGAGPGMVPVAARLDPRISSTSHCNRLFRDVLPLLIPAHSFSSIRRHKMSQPFGLVMTHKLFSGSQSVICHRRGLERPADGPPGVLSDSVLRQAPNFGARDCYEQIDCPL